jgi:hypothetical protein
MRLWLKDSERRPDPKPVQSDDRKAILVGLVLWLVALAGLLVFLGPILEGGHSWWLWTVLETELMPGEGALLAPDWVPWSQRLEEYRAAQAAAGEPDETASLEGDDEDDDDPLDDDNGDDPDDGIDFESSDLLAVGEDEQDESESEADEDGPEPPAVAALEDGSEEDQ